MMLGLLLNKPEYFLLGSVSIFLIFYCLIVLLSTKVVLKNRQEFYYNASVILLSCILMTACCLLLSYYFIYIVTTAFPFSALLSIRFKIIVLTLFIMYMIMFLINHRDYKDLPTEYIVHSFFVLIASVVMVSASDLLSVFLALEAQAIAVIFLIAFEINDRKSTEAAWRYFLANGVASAFLLLGLAFIIIGNGSFFFDVSTLCIQDSSFLYITKYVVLGVLFFLIGLSIKLGVAPMHWWMPFVYEGLSGNTLALLGVVSKVAQVGVLVKVVMILGYAAGFGWFFLTIGLFSVIIGGFGTVASASLKRQVAFLSVYSSGMLYLFLSQVSVYSLMFMIYYILISNVFLFMYVFLLTKVRLKTTWDLKTFKDAFPGSAYSLTIFLIGILGLPPLVGFLPKYLFLSSLGTQLQYLYIFVFLASTVLIVYAAANLFKEMFFDLLVTKHPWLIRVKYRHIGEWNSIFIIVVFVTMLFSVIALSSLLLTGF